MADLTKPDSKAGGATTPAANGPPKPGEANIQSLLDRLDRVSVAAEAAGKARLKPRERRYAYRRSNLGVAVEHPGGGVARFRAHARNISCGGIGLLYHGFLYARSSCNVTLRKRDNTPHMLAATVIYCRHVEGPFHLIGLRFAERLDPLFLEAHRGEANETDELVDLPNLRGRIVHLDDSPMDHKLLEYNLRGSGIRLIPVTTPAEALAALKDGRGEILFCDLNLGRGIDGATVIRDARKQGFTGPIVVITAENGGARLAEVKAAGADRTLPKPYERRALLQVLMAVHQQVGAVASSDVVYSSLSDQPGITDLLVAYIEEVQRIVKDVEAGMVADDFSAVRELCLNIKGSAVGYGFTPLGQAAEATVKALDATMSIEEARAQLRTLTLLCGSLAVRRVGPEGEAR